MGNQTTQNQTTPTHQTDDEAVKGPKALFWYLTLFFTLGVTAFNVGGLWFQFINKWFPKEILIRMVMNSFDQSALKFNIASILVATPIFFLFSFFIRKSLKNNLLETKNKIRNWTSYIILFLTVAIAVGDLIAIIFRVLDGDFAARFILKACTILFIVGWVFFYYWAELRSPNSLIDSKIPKIMSIITIVIIAVSFIGGFFVIDSPITARNKAYDQTRINNLQEIKNVVDMYYQEYQELPESLSALTKYQKLMINDPSNNPYEYRVVDDQSYELCAEFETSNQEEEIDYYLMPGYNEFGHDAGRNCFLRKAVNNDFQKPMDARPLSPSEIK